MITADTNLLVRIVVRDDEDQWRRAREELAHADGVIITNPATLDVDMSATESLRAKRRAAAAN